MARRQGGAGMPGLARRAALVAGVLLAAAPAAAQAPATLGRAPAPGRAQAPVALVIGNAAYSNQPKLPSCEMSANLVAAALSRAGVKVIRLDNPSNARMGSAIAALGDETVAPGSRALVYVCGYVASYGDRLFLVPVEARLDRDADLLSQGIVARLLLGSVVGPDSEAGLVLVDAAALPGQKGALAFDALRRPDEVAHAGLLAASLSTSAVGSPAPLATALADMLGGGPVELQAALAALGRQPGMQRALLTVQPPGQPSWLLGAPPPAAPVGLATPEPAAPQALPAAEPPPPVVAAPPPVVAAPPSAVAAPPPAVAASPPVVAPPPVESKPVVLADPNPAERRRLQLGLQKLGYFKGRINGVFGNDTLAAIRQFQKDSMAEPTGKLTTVQMDQLLQ